MNVREATRILSGAKELYISWNGSITRFDPDSILEMDAFGDYKVHRITDSHEKNTFEIEIAVAPIKEI